MSVNLQNAFILIVRHLLLYLKYPSVKSYLVNMVFSTTIVVLT